MSTPVHEIVRSERPARARHRRLARPGPADRRGARRGRRQDHADVAQGGRPRRGRGAPARQRHRRALDRRRRQRPGGRSHKVCDETLSASVEIDILVNNAGATWGAPAEDHPLEAWDKVMNLNVRRIFLFSQAIGKRSMIPRQQPAASSTSRRSRAWAATRRTWRRWPTTPARARSSTSRARWPASGARTASPSTRSRRASSRAR